MRVTIRLFARLRDIVGASEVQRDMPAGATAGAAWEALVADHADLAAYGASLSVAVNEEYARRETPLSEGDEVAFLPPVSGG